ncbi:hypothetical protein RvY_01200 [Ramazzottius varieornatus]|uniref:EGF-like domain-containing protein n=1 Tax=Ramazzottius varieornatus TaxID=947166 RepID=A0A1D1UQ73_RAMVA|nr:hypothetical protein RvY_01200 [Ramazzottius varieornatus]
MLACDCRPGFVGNHCQFRDPCVIQPRRCSNGGTCRAVFLALNGTTSSDSVEPTFECLCKRGYLGPNCTTVDFCAAYPCDCQGHSNSVCRNLENGYACECRKGYRGLWCNIDIDECTLEEPCANGGTCINTIGSYRCVCRNGFKGQKCTEVHVPCAENPCQNGGRCHPGSSVSFPDFCECASGFSGSHCEVNIDDCIDNACQNGGTCQDQVNGYTCQCSRPYGGRYCNEEIGYE